MRENRRFRKERLRKEAENRNEKWNNFSYDQQIDSLNKRKVRAEKQRIKISKLSKKPELAKIPNYCDN